MGQAISTQAIWGAAQVVPNSANFNRIEKIIDSAFVPGALVPGALTPMLMASDIAKVLDLICAESDLATLEMVKQQGLHCGGVLAEMIEASETVADAIRVVLTYNCRHAEPVYWTGSMRGDHAALTAWIDRPAGLTVAQAERITVVGTLQLVAGFSAALGEAFKPLVIRIKPSQLGADWPEDFLGVPIEANATETELLIDRACLTLPNPRRKASAAVTPLILAEHERYQDEAKASLLRNDTCSWIRSHLPLGDCDLTQLAARLNCDKRTLQRRFERELSCRFSDLVDDVRAEMCLPLLESGVFPTQVIAEQLGYATSGNFSRFFQRRFGCTPRDWSRLALNCAT